MISLSFSDSDFLKNKYSKPIYGNKELPSLNFQNHIWLKGEGGDPYNELDPIFEAEELERIDRMLDEDEKIKNGGMAMMAYCKSQFTQMSDDEREHIKIALLKYCELDTLAMVMLVEYWQSQVK